MSEREKKWRHCFGSCYQTHTQRALHNTRIRSRMLLYLCVSIKIHQILSLYLCVCSVFFYAVRWTSFPAFSMGKPVKFHHPQKWNDLNCERKKIDFRSFDSMEIDIWLFRSDWWICFCIEEEEEKHRFKSVCLSRNRFGRYRIGSVTFFCWFDIYIKSLSLQRATMSRAPNEDEKAAKTFTHHHHAARTHKQTNKRTCMLDESQAV